LRLLQAWPGKPLGGGRSQAAEGIPPQGARGKGWLLRRQSEARNRHLSDPPLFSRVGTPAGRGGVSPRSPGRPRRRMGEGGRPAAGRKGGAEDSNATAGEESFQGDRPEEGLHGQTTRRTRVERGPERDSRREALDVLEGDSRQRTLSFEPLWGGRPQGVGRGRGLGGGDFRRSFETGPQGGAATWLQPREEERKGFPKGRNVIPRASRTALTVGFGFGEAAEGAARSCGGRARNWPTARFGQPVIDSCRMSRATVAGQRGSLPSCGGEKVSGQEGKRRI